MDSGPESTGVEKIAKQISDFLSDDPDAALAAEALLWAKQVGALAMARLYKRMQTAGMKGADLLLQTVVQSLDARIMREGISVEELETQVPTRLVKFLHDEEALAAEEQRVEQLRHEARRAGYELPIVCGQLQFNARSGKSVLIISDLRRCGQFLKQILEQLNPQLLDRELRVLVFGLDAVQPRSYQMQEGVHVLWAPVASWRQVANESENLDALLDMLTKKHGDLDLLVVADANQLYHLLSGSSAARNLYSGVRALNEALDRWNLPAICLAPTPDFAEADGYVEEARKLLDHCTDFYEVT